MLILPFLLLNSPQDALTAKEGIREQGPSKILDELCDGFTVCKNFGKILQVCTCLLYTSDAADDAGQV